MVEGEGTELRRAFSVEHWLLPPLTRFPWVCLCRSASTSSSVGRQHSGAPRDLLERVSWGCDGQGSGICMGLDTSKGSVDRISSYHFKASTQVWNRAMTQGNDNGDPGFTWYGCARVRSPQLVPRRAGPQPSSHRMMPGPGFLEPSLARVGSPRPPSRVSSSPVPS